MQRLAIFVFAVLLTGCSTTTKSLRMAVNVPSSTSFEFIDSRAPQDRTAYPPEGTLRAASFADDNMIPTPPELIKAWLQQALASELKGKPVELESFDFGLSFNRGGTNPGHAPGVALVDLGMNSALGPKVVFVRIGLSVKGRRVYVNASDRYFGVASEANLMDTLNKARDSLVEQVRNAAAVS